MYIANRTKVHSFHAEVAGSCSRVLDLNKVRSGHAALKRANARNAELSAGRDFGAYA